MKKDIHTVLLSTAYLAPVSYFAYLAKARTAIIEQHETYPKQTYRNRCEIYTERGKMQLTIPVTKTFGNKTTTKDIEIFQAEKWQLNHWRAIESAYLASPFFLFYQDELENFYTSTRQNLLEFNMQLTKVLCEIIGLDVELEYSKAFEKSPENVADLRFDISPKKDTPFDQFQHYIQVFGERHGFIPNLSIIDLLFNLGPETKNYLMGVKLPHDLISW